MGYNNHSEIGWVHREHTKLMDDALNIGITSPENYYNEGKAKGKLSRERGIVGQRVSENGNSYAGAVDISDAKGELSESSDKIEELSLLSKPKLSELPGLVKKIKAMDIPKSLEGFKHSQKE